MYALFDNGYSASLKWSVTTGGEVRTSPTLHTTGSVLYAASQDSLLYALDTATGATIWTHSLAPAGLSSSPAVTADGRTVYLGGENGQLYAVAVAADGLSATRKWSLNIGTQLIAAPMIGTDGTVYLGCDDFKVRRCGRYTYACGAFKTGAWATVP